MAVRCAIFRGVRAPASLKPLLLTYYESLAYHALPGRTRPGLIEAELGDPDVERRDYALPGRTRPGLIEAPADA